MLYNDFYLVLIEMTNDESFDVTLMMTNHKFDPYKPFDLRHKSGYDLKVEKDYR